MSKLRKDERLRRLYMSYIDDGILDMFVGFIALFAGLLMFTDMLWMAGVYVAIFLPTVWSIKEKVTMPRLRREELSPDTAKSSTKMLGAFIAGLLLFMVLGVLFLLLQNAALSAGNARGVPTYYCWANSGRGPGWFSSRRPYVSCATLVRLRGRDPGHWCASLVAGHRTTMGDCNNWGDDGGNGYILPDALFTQPPDPARRGTAGLVGL